MAFLSFGCFKFQHYSCSTHCAHSHSPCSAASGSLQMVGKVALMSTFEKRSSLTCSLQ